MLGFSEWCYPLLLEFATIDQAASQGFYKASKGSLNADALRVLWICRTFDKTLPHLQ